VGSATDRFLAIEIGGTKLQLTSGDASGKLFERNRLSVEKEGGAASIQKQIENAIADFKGPFRAVGVGFGGPVDWQTGRIARSHQIEGWSGFALAEWLAGLTGCPAVVDNDGNVGALGEARFGAGQGFNPVFYVTLGSGVGGGLILNGQIYHGARPGESEIGHVRLDRSGATVESRCSGWAVDAKVREAARRNRDSLLAGLVGNSKIGEARYLLEAIQNGDAEAKAILMETAADLAFGLSHVVHLFHPEVVILGGGLSKIGEPLRAAVAAALTPYLMEVFRPGPEVRISKLEEDAVPLGALALAVSARL
jgi:glucokinase